MSGFDKSFHGFQCVSFVVRLLVELSSGVFDGFEILGDVHAFLGTHSVQVVIPEIGYSVVKVEGFDFCPSPITAEINTFFHGLQNNIFFAGRYSGVNGLEK